MLMKTLRDFGAVIRDARKAKGLTQTDLAKKLGIRQDWISNIEGGRIGNPSLGTVLQVCAVLDIEIRADRVSKAPVSVRLGDLATDDPPFRRRSRR
jgi:HTH-type transcriptional regulator / antitoxin HipB